MDVKNKILVTGGTGMIGSYVVKNLLEKNYQVVVLTRRKKINKKNLNYFKGDISDMRTLSGLMKNVSVVIHLAACSDLTLPLPEFNKINIQGTKNILDLAIKNGVKLIINTSSTVVFGGSPLVEKNEKTVFKNGVLDKYTETKIKNLFLINEYRNKNLNIINVYPTAVIDINKKPKLNSQKIINLIWKITGGIPGGLMGLFGSGKRWINYVLVEDVSKGIILAMEKGRKNGDYILGGENILIKDYLKKMAKIFKSYYFPIRFPSWMTKVIWKISLEDNRFSILRAKKELNYFPKK